MRSPYRSLARVLCLGLISAFIVPGGGMAVPGNSLDDFPGGDQPADEAEIGRLLLALDQASPRLVHSTYGSSHEGRPLRVAVIGSERNIGRLDEIRRGLAARAEGSQAGDLPLVVWVGAAIHGNEPSGADAALALAWHLAMDPSEKTADLLDRVIVLVDPLQNPDGRARFLQWMRQWESAVPQRDDQSLAHRGSWPSGRGNHYFLDLNRDWYALSQPETRARVRLFLEWHPQVTLDLHEMGSFDSYLFSPPARPYTPQLPSTTPRWWNAIADSLSGAFAERGWASYSRDWHEEFNPNRGAAWPLLTGAVSFLAEQAGTDGKEMTLPGGGERRYRDAVEKQYTTARVLVEMAASHADGILEDWLKSRKHAREQGGAWFIDASHAPGRAGDLANLLREQGVTVFQTREDFGDPGARNYWGEERGDEDFPAGGYLVMLDSGEARLARGLLDFDPRPDEEFIHRERESLEAGRGSLVYESTAWCLAMSSGCEAWRLDRVPRVGLGEALTPQGRLEPGPAPLGYMLPADSPGYARALARLHGEGLTLRATLMGFVLDGRCHGPGTVFVPRGDSGGDLDATLAGIARETGAEFLPLAQSRVEEGPDLGARPWRLLAPPRVALLSGSPYYQTTFGALWHHLDRDLHIPTSLLRLADLGSLDLDRYNLILLPDARSGSGPELLLALQGSGLEALRSWIARGGSLVALGESAFQACGGPQPLCGLRIRESDDDQEEWLRRFSPRGSILRANLDPRHWVSAGLGARLPVFVKTETVLEAPVQGRAAGSFADEDSLRVSGMLWPEAAARLAGSTYLYQEPVGRGQVVVIQGNPVYRAYWRGSARLLDNVLLLGPGLGAVADLRWRP